MLKCFRQQGKRFLRAITEIKIIGVCQFLPAKAIRRIYDSLPIKFLQPGRRGGIHGIPFLKPGLRSNDQERLLIQVQRRYPFPLSRNILSKNTLQPRTHRVSPVPIMTGIGIIKVRRRQGLLISIMHELRQKFITGIKPRLTKAS